MWQILAATLVLLVVIFGFYGKYLGRNSEEVYKNGFYSKYIADEKLDRKEIRKLLNNLPESLGRTPEIGAMCYKSGGPPDRVEYTCPTCGEKTLYIRDKNDDYSYTFWRLIDWDLNECRRSIGKIKGITIQLDERDFCHKCRKNLKPITFKSSSSSINSGEPSLIINVLLANETTVHRINKVTLDDIELLIEFTNGEIAHKNRYEESLLINHFKRLEELLGVSSTYKIKKRTTD